MFDWLFKNKDKKRIKVYKKLAKKYKKKYQKLLAESKLVDATVYSGACE